MLCETRSGSKHKAYIEAISCLFKLLIYFKDIHKFKKISSLTKFIDFYMFLEFVYGHVKMILSFINPFTIM